MIFTIYATPTGPMYGGYSKDMTGADDEVDMRDALSRVKGDKLRLRLLHAYNYEKLWAKLAAIRTMYSSGKTLEEWCPDVLLLPILVAGGETMKRTEKNARKKGHEALDLHFKQAVLQVQMWETVLVNTESVKSYTPMLSGKFEPTKTKKGINHDVYLALWESNESNKLPGKDFACFISDDSLCGNTDILSRAKSFELDWKCAYCSRFVICNKCSGCHKVRYCDTVCQQAHREKHAPTCC